MTENSSMPFNHYDFMSRKGLNINYASYWTPLFNGSVFDPMSLPENRKNKAFEIRGITLPSASITTEAGTFTVKNHSLAVFNSKGILVEVIGGLTEEEIRGMIAFTGTWTPASISGFRTYWQTSLGENVTFATLSNENYTCTITSNNSAPADTGIYFSNIFTNPHLKFGIPFQVSGLTATSIVQVGFVKRTGNTELLDILTDATIVLTNNGTPNTIQLEVIGNTRNDPTDLSTIIPIVIPVTGSTRFMVSLDENAGTNGTIYFYCSDAVAANSNDPNTPIYTYAFTDTVDLDLMDSLYFYSNVSGTDMVSVSIVNDSNYVPTGVTNITGGLFDENSLPINASGRAFTVDGLGLNNFVYVTGYGDAYDGDMIFWNALGEIQGRPWPRTVVEREVVANIGMHITNGVIAQGLSNSHVHTHPIENQLVFMNGGLLAVTSDYTINIDNSISLVTPVALSTGAEIVIITFNNVN